MISGLVALVWLGKHGEWGAVIGGVLLFFLSGTIVNVLLLITTPLTLYSAHRLNSGKPVPLLQFLHSLLTALTMGVLSCGTMYVLVQLSDGPGVWTPLMLASFSVSVGAFLHLAAKNDAPSGGFGISSVMAVLNALVFIAVAVSIRLAGLSFKSTCIAYSVGCFVIAVICHVVTARMISKPWPEDGGDKTP